MKNYFCGRYFKCETDRGIAAVIAAYHITGGVRTGSVQIITDDGAWGITVPDGELQWNEKPFSAVIGNCRFSMDGMHIDIDGAELNAAGDVAFSRLSCPGRDIMGPFRFVPFMECRHSVYSMCHRADGALTVNGRRYVMDGTRGYTEGDRGRSFPSKYAWTHTFFDGGDGYGSLMLSVATIPLGPVRFTGTIGFVFRDGAETRIATYKGARVKLTEGGSVKVKQGRLLLTASRKGSRGFALRAPETGSMSRTIHENASCAASYCLTENGRDVLSFETDSASFEYEYEN